MMTGEELSGVLLIWYCIVPASILLVFLIMGRVWHGMTNKTFFKALLIYGIIPIVIFFSIGGIIEVYGTEDLILAMRILAQALPLSFGIFVYSDVSADEQRGELKREIWKLEARIRELEKENELEKVG